jgi:hypothetical protein
VPYFCANGESARHEKTTRKEEKLRQDCNTQTYKGIHDYHTMKNALQQGRNIRTNTENTPKFVPDKFRNARNSLE